VTSVAAAALLLLSACSGSAQFALVNQDGEYSYVALKCDTLVKSITVSPYDFEKSRRLAGQWTITSTAPDGSLLPASGVALGTVPAGFTEAAAPPSDLLTSGSVRIEVDSNAQRPVRVFRLDLRVGEYQNTDGTRGKWSALQAERGC
jgi:hypothetical protein